MFFLKIFLKIFPRNMHRYKKYMNHLLICIRKCILHTLKIHLINNKQKKTANFQQPFFFKQLTGAGNF